ncbi:MAG TPA: ATP-grasp domain-containing protein [Steroidobacteraceae bacterium]|jgi:hypothetical protein
MRLLYPSDPISSKRADDTYAQEFEAARSAGFEVSLFSFEDFERGIFTPRPNLQPDEAVLYPGWMLTVPRFKDLLQAIGLRSARPFTSAEEYAATHHLPQWYPLLSELTAETVVLDQGADFVRALGGRNWPGYFIKDYVKSLSTGDGSLVTRPEDIAGIVSLMMKYRGFVEGGVCVRRKEEYEPASERRYFVFRGKPLATAHPVPELVATCAARIKSPFYSVDVARRLDGELRVIELGDGQVSDRKEWPADHFIATMYEAANKPMQPTCEDARG